MGNNAVCFPLYCYAIKPQELDLGLATCFHNRLPKPESILFTFLLSFFRLIIVADTISWNFVAFLIGKKTSNRQTSTYLLFQPRDNPRFAPPKITVLFISSIFFSQRSQKVLRMKNNAPHFRLISMWGSSADQTRKKIREGICIAPTYSVGSCATVSAVSSKPSRSLLLSACAIIIF